MYDMTPTDFEKHCLDILSAYASKEKLPNFKITHNKKISAADGKYQIDVYGTFTALGCEIKMLCECKRYKSPVKREIVSQLHDKLSSTGSQKGIIMSTSGFQRGAIDYAKTHGIALIHIRGRECTYLSHSSDPIKNNENNPFTYADRHLPPLEAVLCTEVSEDEDAFYPTSEMKKVVNDEMERLIAERFGHLF